jgi:hypothetical protein
MHKKQQGAALIYGLFVLAGSAAALFYQFNYGQLVREKNQLVNTADAVAYSAGVMHARALNYLSYTNRSFIANEVLVAQTVSLSSWARYLGSWGSHVGSVHPECGTTYQYVGALKYNVDYAVACWTMAVAREAASVYGGVVGAGAEGALAAVAFSQGQLLASQAVVVAGMSPVSPISPSRGSILQQVADANYVNEPSAVRVVGGVEALLPDDWTGFSQRYTANDRQRLKNVVMEAADDGFVVQRQWTSRAMVPMGWCGFQEVRRRGGTDLLGFDEWHAVDTQAFRSRRMRSFFRCRTGESPTGYTAQEAVRADVANVNGRFGRAQQDTPSTFQRAQRPSRPGSQDGKQSSPRYIGLPSFFDLSSARMRENDPVLRFGVRVERSLQKLRVTDGASAVRQGQGTLSPFATVGPSSGRGAAMHAVAVSEVYYRNPNPGKQAELGSLFQPYWHVRLAPAPLAQSWLPMGVAATF